MNLAQAPSQPQGARIANANALSNYTILDWDPVLKPDGSVDESVSYQILISKDNFFYAVRAIRDGHASLPTMCY